MRTLRSRGVTILISAQDTTSIEITYGIMGRRAIYANCAYKLLLTLADSGDQEMFSKEAGSVFVEHKSFSEGASYNFSSNGVSTGRNKGVTTALKERRLIYPPAFANLKDIVCITPEGSFQVRKSQYIKNAKEGDQHE